MNTRECHPIWRNWVLPIRTAPGGSAGRGGGGCRTGVGRPGDERADREEPRRGGDEDGEPEERHGALRMCQRDGGGRDARAGRLPAGQVNGGRGKPDEKPPGDGGRE